MKLVETKFLPKSLLLGAAAILLVAGCSNSSFKSNTTSANQPNSNDAPIAGEDAQRAENNGFTTTSIPTSELAVPGALKNRPDSIFASFPTSVVKDASYPFALDTKGVSTSFKLEDINSPKQDSFKQNTRTPVTDKFKQGNPGQAMTDTFIQTAKKGLVDILVVIDNSGSMNEEQNNLSTKLNELLVSIKDSNWQINVITTSPAFPNMTAGQSAAYARDANSEGKELCNSTLIKSTDADAMTKFAAAVTAGTNGDGNEQGIRQSVVGLRCTERPWLRPGVSLAVLIVSDEDNCSFDGGDCGGLNWSKEAYLENYVEGTLKRTVGKDAGFYGIVAPSRALCATAGNPAPQYIRLFDYKSTPGLNYGNICDANYKTTLNRISDNIANLLTSQFELKNVPDAGSLLLTIKSAAGVVTPVDPTSYTQVAKVISFMAGKEPPVGSTLIASYAVGAVPMFDSVILISDPAAGTITVNVNGAALGAGTFTSNARVITFNQKPPAAADIVVGYRLNTALIDRFKLGDTPIAGTLSVKVNAQAVANYTYDAATGDLVFVGAPLDGMTIDASYTYRQGPKLSYQVPLMAGGSNFKITEGATPIAFTQVTDTFTITAAQHQAGKTLTLSYDLPDSAARIFALGRTPLPNTAKIETLAGACSLGNGLSISGANLVATCPVTSKTEFTLSFKYQGLQKAFSIKGIANPSAGTWQVYYNSQPTTDYTRTDSTITLNFDPELDSRVDISYTFPE